MSESDLQKYCHSGGCLVNRPTKNILHYRAILRFTYPNDAVCFNDILEYYKNHPEDEKLIADGRPLKCPLRRLLRWIWNRLIDRGVLIKEEEEEYSEDTLKVASLQDSSIDAW